MKERFKKFINKTKAIFSDPDQRQGFFNDIAKFFMSLVRVLILVGVGYAIVSPLIGMFVSSIASTSDIYDPMMYVLPKYPTLEKYKLVIERMDYFKTIGRDILYVVSLTLIQVFVCSFVGYGFARFKFPLKNLFFACVVLMITIPMHTIMLPVYMTFKNMDPFGLATKLTGTPGVMGTVIPMYLMTIFACGVRSGLYIYIFNQFFRGLPKEIEEAAYVDGASVWYTYFRIMLVNAKPAIVTVAVFSLVWQFNDTFYSNLFLISENVVISKKIASLAAVIANQDLILNVTLQEQYVNAGALLVVLPILLIYIILQKQFIEGVERSGIVG